jgi:dihydrofolate reductase
MKMKLTIIAAVSENNVIGKDNRLLWKLPADMKFFKDKTYDHCIITGRKNYESIPEKYRPLPGRINIIVTHNPDYDAPGTICVPSIEDALAEARRLHEDEAFIIGGGEIYKQTIGIADEMWITKVHKDFEGDTVFPEIDKNVWNEEERLKFSKDDKHNYNFSMYRYTRKK